MRLILQVTKLPLNLEYPAEDANFVFRVNTTFAPRYFSVQLLLIMVISANTTHMMPASATSKCTTTTVHNIFQNSSSLQHMYILDYLTT